MLETHDSSQEVTTTSPPNPGGDCPTAPISSQQGPEDSTPPQPGSATPPDSSSATPPNPSTEPSPDSTHSPISDPSSSPSQEPPSRDLVSPTEVRSKPAVSAYSANPHVIPISEGEESEEGLGPDVSVILGDEQDTILPYDVVRDMEVGYCYL